jgi:two-component system, NtrC family, response regulator AlgB
MRCRNAVQRLLLSAMRALLVGCEPKMQRSLSLMLPQHGCLVDVAPSMAEATAFLAARQNYQLLISGDPEAVSRLRQAAPSALLVVATQRSTSSEIVSSMQAGAADVWEGIPPGARVEKLLQKAVKLQQPVRHTPDLVGDSPAMQRLLGEVEAAARSSAPVLLRGETGSGKGRLARLIHGLSPRAGAPFVLVDCAGLSPTLAENELFGHARGAFTGAEREAPGKLEAADGGTVFLDEVGELPQPTQQKLLRFLEDGELERLGDVRPRHVDARPIAATHRDLRGLVASGAFREDLLYRLEVLDLVVPPLRERVEDIPGLLSALLAGAGAPESRFDDVAMEELRRHTWPGNVRELRNVVERALALAKGSVLGVEVLPARILRPTASAASTLPDLANGERERITEALRLHPSLEEAAAALGIDPSTLWRKRKRLGLA